MTTTEKHGVIVDYDGHVYFRFGEHGESQGSEPLLDKKRNPTRESAKKRILKLMWDNGVTTFDFLDGR